jgi:hypothetical protein
MDGYQFIAAILQSVVSLAWPAAVFGSVWLFRDKLRAATADEVQGFGRFIQIGRSGERSSENPSNAAEP